MVVLHHLGVAMASSKYFGADLFAVPFTAGDSGVEFFFVLSGFIITWAHFKDFGRRGAVKQYVWKRAVRIYPSYWIVFSLVYCFAQLSTTLRATVPHDYLTLIKSLALVPQDPSVVGWSGAPVVAVAWTLQYEICFYVAVAVSIFNPYLGILLFLAFLLNFVACHNGSCSFPRSFFSSQLMWLFVFGAFVAFSIKRNVPSRRPALIAGVAAGVFVVLVVLEAQFGTDMLPIDRRLAYGLTSGVLIFGLVQCERRGYQFGQSAAMSLLGNSSYSLYLIHYPLISLLCKLLLNLGLAGNAGAAVAYPIILCLCVVVSAGFYLLVEKPILEGLGKRGSITRHIPNSGKL